MSVDFELIKRLNKRLSRMKVRLLTKLEDSGCDEAHLDMVIREIDWMRSDMNYTLKNGVRRRYSNVDGRDEGAYGDGDE